LSETFSYQPQAFYLSTINITIETNERLFYLKKVYFKSQME